MELGYQLEDESNEFNKYKYLKQAFNRKTTNIMTGFSKYARVMGLFKSNTKNDFNFDIEPKMLAKYTDHGVQFIAETCLKNVNTFMQNLKNISLENLILIRYNLYQLEKHVLRFFIDDTLSFEKDFLETIMNMKNNLYEQIITVLNAEIENSLTIFINGNFKKKNAVKKSPDLFLKLVQPLLVF